jgi:RNA polymerase sigma factor (sigma-70 family)
MANLGRRGRNRSNEEWVAELSSADRTLQRDAFDDLGRYLRSYLIRDVAGRAATLPALQALDQVELEAVADDLVQETLIRLHKNLSQYNGSGAFLSYALVTARRLLISEFRKKQWTTAPMLALTEETHSEANAAHASPSFAEIPDPKQLAPETNLILREMGEVAYAAIEKDLSENQRHVFCAYYFHNIPFATIAENLGKSRSAIDQLMLQARAKIRRRLIQRGYDIDMLDKL